MAMGRYTKPENTELIKFSILLVFSVFSMFLIIPISSVPRLKNNNNIIPVYDTFTDLKTICRYYPLPN